MELIDRYLQAVRFWLPREQKDDIAHELEDDLRAEIEDQESALGRPVNAAETEAILRRRGRPFVVANRYLPQRHLIGPLLFPIYAFVLKLIGLVYVLPWILVWVAFFTFAPSHRHHVMRDAASLAWIVTQIFAVVTIIFAVQEHYFGAPELLAKWEPSRLLKSREPQIDRTSSAGAVFEIVINVIFLVWWCGGIGTPLDTVPNIGTVWPAFHRTFFVAVIGLALLGIANAAISLSRPYARRTYRLIRALGSAGGAAIAGSPVVSRGTEVAHAFQRAVTVHAPAAQSWAVGAIIDGSVLITLAIIAIGCAITAVVEAYRATGFSAYGTMSKLTT